jgi:hypothetical protein
VALAAGLAQSLGKLSLDAVIQRDVPEAVRTSAFARSETLLQLSWVVGGGVGIVLPLNGALGLGLAALGLVVMLVLTIRAVRALPPGSPSTRRGRTRWRPDDSAGSATGARS